MSKKSIGIIIVVLALITAVICIMSNVTKDKDISFKNPGISVQTKIYFSDESSSSLVAEEISFNVKNEDEKYLAAVKKLIEGPSEEGLYPSVNEKTVVNSINIKDKLCTVDFSSSLTEYNTGGLREMICLFAVVNTLCEFDEVDKVIFTIDGNGIKTFGQLDMSEPYEFDSSMVK